jgi:hypothetical protein
MIKRLTLLATLACAFPAHAQSTDTGNRQLEITGVAPPACIMRAPNATGGVNASYQSLSGSSGEIRIVEMVNPQTAQPRATSVDLTVPVICNSAHLLSVESTNGGLRRLGGNARNQSRGGFAEFLPYNFAANWAGQNVTQSSQTQGGLRIVTNDGGAGNVLLSVAVPANGSPLVAGAYTDSIIIQFRAAN